MPSYLTRTVTGLRYLKLYNITQVQIATTPVRQHERR